MTETLSKAWSLFDAGNYTDAETLYKECYAKIPSTDHDNYWQVLMGLIYAESFLEHFAEARTYASQLISCAIDHEEKHIAIHQAGMIERMAAKKTIFPSWKHLSASSLEKSFVMLPHKNGVKISVSIPTERKISDT